MLLNVLRKREAIQAFIVHCVTTKREMCIYFLIESSID